MTPTETVISRLRDRGCNPRQSRPGQWTSRCPNGAGHKNGDRHPSLSVGEGRDGCCVLHCAGGCHLDHVVAALDLHPADLFPPRQRDDQTPRIEAVYDYFDEHGELVMQAVRYHPKTFRQRQPDGAGGWRWTLQGLERRPLYRLPQILAAIRAGQTIWIAEGEKDVDALVRAGVEATCNPMGARKWRPEHTGWLTGATRVEIVADDDQDGHTHALSVLDAIHDTVPNVNLWLPAHGCKDIAEHLGQGRRLEDLRPFHDSQPADNPLLDLLINWDTFWDKDHKTEEWLAWPLIPAGRQVALYAPAKTGKSILTLAVVAALATGRPILGNVPQDPVHVLYLDYEMTEADLYERLEALGYGADDKWTHLHYASLPSLPPLNTKEGADKVAELAQLVHAQLVVVDTTGRAVDGDENDAGPYREFAQHTGLTLKRLGIAVLRTDHAGKDKAKGQRGSSAKNDDVDVVIRLDTAEGGYVLTRTYSRVGWVPDKVPIIRTTLKDGTVEFTAKRGAPMWEEGTKETAADLDALGAPVNISRRAAETLLKQAGKGKRSKVVGHAVNYRKGLGADGL